MHPSPANEPVTSVAVDADAGSDVARSLAFRRSLRTARKRRAIAVRRRRRSLRSRCSLLAAAACLAVLSAGAVAAGDKPAQPRLAKATIKAAQTALRVQADGVIGPKTRRATRRFQRRHRLLVDGILGPQTLKALGIRRRVGSARAGESVRVTLARIAQCESAGDPAAVSASRRYRGKYQFSRRTWRSVGGTGDPAKATEGEQDRRALKLYKRDGTAPWPNCA